MEQTQNPLRADQWTDRHDDLLDPRRDAAKIRAFFIHPDWAGAGLARFFSTLRNRREGRRLLALRDGATLTGAKLFRAGLSALRNLESLFAMVSHYQSSDEKHA